jgi:hypothetical protein
METLQEKIHLITKYQKPYIANSLKGIPPFFCIGNLLIKKVYLPKTGR